MPTLINIYYLHGVMALNDSHRGLCYREGNLKGEVGVRMERRKVTRNPVNLFRRGRRRFPIRSTPTPPRVARRSRHAPDRYSHSNERASAPSCGTSAKLRTNRLPWVTSSTRVCGTTCATLSSRAARVAPQIGTFGTTSRVPYGESTAMGTGRARALFMPIMLLQWV
jgi:hypothetical protein